MSLEQDTIAAIATPLGNGAIGIVRMSGSQSLSIAQRIFRPHKKHFLSHHIYYGHIVDKREEIIDEVLLSIMKAPHSYTTEDMVEINCHGGIIVLKKVLSILLENGARMAQPGEFTKMAFLNGRIDLLQAEAVAEVISAKTERALMICQNQLSGKLSQIVRGLREKLLLLLSYNEVMIDYPEEDYSNISIESKLKIVDDIYGVLDKLLQSASSGINIVSGVTLSIVGKPNVGKSSLLNALLNDERAIVTDIPGTTRDVISEYITLNGVPFRILDTAGIRKTEGLIESLGVERSKDSIEKADIVVFVLDVSRELDEEDKVIIDLLKNASCRKVIFANKVDLDKKINKEKLADFFPQCPIVEGCLLDNRGLDKLKKEIYGQIIYYNVNDSEIAVTNERQKKTLEKAMWEIPILRQHIEDDIDPALISIEIQFIVSALDELIGNVTTEDMLDKMFSIFCLGK